MNMEIFSSILAALVVARLIEPGVNALRDKIWGSPRAAAKINQVASGASSAR